MILLWKGDKRSQVEFIGADSFVSMSYLTDDTKNIQILACHDSLRVNKDLDLRY